MCNTNSDDISRDSQAAYLEEHGNILAEGAAGTLRIKYYSYGDAVYKIAYYNWNAVAIVKLSQEEMGVILSCSDLDFKEW